MKLAQISLIMVLAYLVIGVLDATLNYDLTSSGMSTGNIIFDILLHPWNWNDQTFWTIIGGVGVLAAGIFVGTLVLSKSDLSSLATLAAVFLAFGSYMMANIYSFILNNIILYIPGCQIGFTCYEANLITGLLGAIIGIYYFYSVLEWWAWRPTSSH